MSKSTFEQETDSSLNKRFLAFDLKLMSRHKVKPLNFVEGWFSRIFSPTWLLQLIFLYRLQKILPFPALTKVPVSKSWGNLFLFWLNCYLSRQNIKIEILFCKGLRPRCAAGLMHNDFGSDLEPPFHKEPFVPYKNTILENSSIPWKKILLSSWSMCYGLQ